MPRALRLLFEHAIYHVINRGNYRAPIFASPGAAQAFEACLFEAAALHHWRLHAFVIMSNHFHLAVETPQANLTESVHWLNSTYATRFNRFRKERGHVFQGRYHAGLVQAGPSLLRVVNYIHLNPVRAGLVDLPGLPHYRWSSLGRFLRGPRPEALSCVDWLREIPLSDDAEGWQAYGRLLAELTADPAQQEQAGFDDMSQRWLIGDPVWRKDLASSFRLEGAAEPACGPERDAIRAQRWQQALTEGLERMGRQRRDLKIARKGADWKIALADELRRSCGANYTWLAHELHLGKAGSARRLLYHRRKNPPPA
jgi:REP element-mobilizing transposase RayT